MIKRLNLLISILIPFISWGLDSELSPYKDEKKGKWGLIDSSGEYIVKPNFSEIEPIDNGFFMVAVGGKVKDGILDGEKWGILDSTGKFVLNAKYDEIELPINGLATIIVGGKYGFADTNWKVVIEPKYDYVGTCNEQGFVWVNSGGKPDKRNPSKFSGGKYGIFSNDGKVIIPVQYKSIGYVSPKEFIFDQTEVNKAKNNFERLVAESGFHTALWPVMIESVSSSKLPYSIGFAFSKSDKILRNGIADCSGKILIKEGEYHKSAMASNGYCLVKTKKNQIGYVNIETGKLQINKDLKDAFSYKNNVAIGIDTQNKWRFIDNNLNFIGDRYNWISPLFGESYIVVKDNCMSLLNASDYSLIVEDCSAIFPPSHGLMAFQEKESGKWGYMNEHGEKVLYPIYEDAFSFKFGVGLVRNSNGWGVINKNFKEVVSPCYASLIFPKEDGFKTIWAKDTHNPYKWHCIDINTGLDSFSPTFDKVWNFQSFGDDQYAAVQNVKKVGVIDRNGAFSIPPIFDNSIDAENALHYKLSNNISDWQEIHYYRFMLLQNPKRNSYSLKDKIPSEMWDY